jgi:hypothetical protein
MGARWYDPAAGQFTTRDTTRVNPDPDSAAANPFAYAGDDPLTATDPTGHAMAMLAGPGGGATQHPIQPKAPRHRPPPASRPPPTPGVRPRPSPTSPPTATASRRRSSAAATSSATGSASAARSHHSSPTA